MQEELLSEEGQRNTPSSHFTGFLFLPGCRQEGPWPGGENHLLHVSAAGAQLLHSKHMAWLYPLVPAVGLGLRAAALGRGR